jgi:hypothetical protein
MFGSVSGLLMLGIGAVVHYAPELHGLIEEVANLVAVAGIFLLICNAEASV